VNAQRRKLAHLINRMLSPLGIEFRCSKTGGRSSMAGALSAMAERGHDFKTIVDVGASNGIWSEMVMQYYPDASYLLIEALPAHESSLVQFCRSHTNAQYILAAAGDRQGGVYFDASSLFGGQASAKYSGQHNLVVPMTTVDTQMQLRNLSGPTLIKLDTHGFETAILEGAKETVAATEMVIVECYNFEIGPDSLLFYQMCCYMRERGFRCIDLAAPVYRPYDDVFWQMDLFFAREEWPGFRHKAYQ
jgi:FkbM family methyltransferase